MSTRLSFCIPTLNFGDYIAETLRSIVAQADSRVEIIIIDGGSTDNTAEKVAIVARDFPNIRFIDSASQKGIDSDILRSVEEAKGDYCWLFSSDDVLAPGALMRVFAAIDRGDWDVFITGMTLCDAELNPQCDHRILSSSEPRTFNWSKHDERMEYFRLAQTSTAFCSFISDVIVRRDAWVRAPETDRFVGSCWIIAAKMFAMSQQELRVRFDPAVSVLKRGDNDSFAAAGLIRRIALSLRGFRELGWFFFGKDSPEAHEISRVIRNEYPFLDVLDLKRRIVSQSSDSTRREFYDLVRLHYPGYSLWHLILCAAVCFAPVSMLSLARPPYVLGRRLARALHRR